MYKDSSAAARRMVLYVEDVPVNALLMSTLFERRPNLQLVVAENGQMALCIANRLQPALILLDLNLPDCHGNDLLPLLRQIPGCDDAPAVAVTADAGFAIAGTGFTELWEKPLNLGWILERLDRFVGPDRYALAECETWAGPTPRPYRQPGSGAGAIPT